MLRTLTLIPNANSYGLAIFVVLGTSAPTLAGRLHGRWLASWHLQLYTVYNVVLAFTASWGCLIFGTKTIVRTSPAALLLSVIIGLLVGWLALWGDQQISRHLFRRRIRRGLSMKSNDQSVHNRKQLARVRVVKRPLTPSRMVEPEMSSGRSTASFDFSTMGSWALITVAVLEELIFRGFLVQASFLLPSAGWISIALVTTVVVFCLSHIQYGWAQVLGKSPLGVLTLASVLITRSVIGAVVAHVVFNVKASAASRQA